MNWNRIWVNRLIAGTQSWVDVPEKRKQGVTEELAMRVANGEITQAQMNTIISEN